MNRLFFSMALTIASTLFISCNKDNDSHDKDYTYYQVGFDTDNADWRDTAFIVRTKDTQLIKKADDQLALPVSTRQIVLGTLVNGNGGYNKNAAHSFQWHFKEDEWDLVDMTIEIYDGKPYTDVDLHKDYWLSTVKRFGAWSSYIKRKLPGKP